eukprot:GHVL01000474.1.p1 GENE.GHVL01000474.1~~GHVL01000474.1.p1  ORF type:complete len:180 (+),score=25.63 GHVL01000474.1:63-602(+)
MISKIFFSVFTLVLVHVSTFNLRKTLALSAPYLTAAVDEFKKKEISEQFCAIVDMYNMLETSEQQSLLGQIYNDLQSPRQPIEGLEDIQVLDRLAKNKAIIFLTPIALPGPCDTKDWVTKYELKDSNDVKTFLDIVVDSQANVVYYTIVEYGIHAEKQQEKVEKTIKEHEEDLVQKVAI